MARVIPPDVGDDDRYFWNGVAEHRLLLQRCARCGTLRHPPVPMCGRCQSTEWDVQEAAGTGTVHSWIVSKPPSEPEDPGRIVILVELTEGLRVVSNLVDTPVDEVRNEMPVTVCFAEQDGVLLPQFRRTEAGGA